MSRLKLLSRYGPFGIGLLAFNFIVTKIFLREATIVRLPFSIKGKKRISFGKNFIAGSGLKIDCLLHSSQLTFGHNFKVGNNFRVAVLDRVDIGENVLVASNVFITDHSHGEYNSSSESSFPNVPPADRPLFSTPVRVGNNCWIGEGVVILMGSNIGDGCVIGANTVINGDVPKCSIVAGAPWKVLKQFDNKSNTWLRV